MSKTTSIQCWLPTNQGLSTLTQSPCISLLSVPVNEGSWSKSEIGQRDEAPMVIITGAHTRLLQCIWISRCLITPKPYCFLVFSPRFVDIGQNQDIWQQPRCCLALCGVESGLRDAFKSFHWCLQWDCPVEAGEGSFSRNFLRLTLLPNPKTASFKGVLNIDQFHSLFACFVHRQPVEALPFSGGQLWTEPWKLIVKGGMEEPPRKRVFDNLGNSVLYG